jgi:hypothetical protein
MFFIVWTSARSTERIVVDPPHEADAIIRESYFEKLLIISLSVGTSKY